MQAPTGEMPVVEGPVVVDDEGLTESASGRPQAGGHSKGNESDMFHQVGAEDTFSTGHSRHRFSVQQTSKSLRRFYRGVYNAFKKDKATPCKNFFNPEELARRKREWLKFRSERDKAPGWPDHNFEHLVIVGIPPTADVTGISREISRESARRKQPGGSTALRPKSSENPHHSPLKPSYPPELLYQFPEEKPLHMSPDDLVSFCFPDGVVPSVLPRTSSMSALNEVVYGQQHMVRSDQSFVFLQKGGDDLPMFGICYYVNQMIHVPPGLTKPKYEDRKLPLKRHLVAAPRCYCFLSRYPFFDLHFQVLNLLLGLERLDSIKEYVDEVSALPPRHSLSNRLGMPGTATPTSSFTPTPTPEPHTSVRPVSASPSPPSSARTSEPGMFGPSRTSPGANMRRRSFSMDPLGRPQEPPRGRSPHIQDSFSSIPGLHKFRKDGCAVVSCKDAAGKSAGVRERSDRASGSQSNSSPMSSRIPMGEDIAEDNAPCCTPDELVTSPFIMSGGPSGSSIELLREGSDLVDVGEGRAPGSREITLAPTSGTVSTIGIPDGRGELMRTPSGGTVHFNPWLHARSISGQSLRGYDGIDESTKPHAPIDPPTETAPTHCRGDSAFHGLDFHSMPLFRSMSGTPPLGLGPVLYSGDSEIYTSHSVSAPGSPWWPLRRSNSQDALSVGCFSLPSNYYRSPSCHEIYSRGITPPLLWRGDPEGMGSRLTAAQSVLHCFHTMPVPEPGERLIFAPEEGLQTIEYHRPKIRSSGPSATEQRHLGAEIAQIEAEAATELRVWTIASLCRSLSLENVLSLMVAAMLEKQIVFFCSNIGVLTSAVLSLVPLLRPFTWQSLLMPVVPSRLLELLDAPVPFAVGLQHKTPEIVQRCGDLVRVNLYKDRIKNAPPASSLPDYRQLLAKLAPWHKKLQQTASYTRRPMHVPTSTECSAVDGFTRVFGSYLQKLVGDLRRHTITDVGQNGERVCLLLEDSLVESFPQKDWPFMKAFVETQMFSSYSDAVISRFE